MNQKVQTQPIFLFLKVYPIPPRNTPISLARLLKSVDCHHIIARGSIDSSEDENYIRQLTENVHKSLREDGWQTKLLQPTCSHRRSRRLCSPLVILWHLDRMPVVGHASLDTLLGRDELSIFATASLKS